MLADLRKDHPPADQLLQTFRDTLGGLRQFIEQQKIITIPSTVPPIVEETPPFARALTTASMDTPGAYETKAKEAMFNVTLARARLEAGEGRGVDAGIQPRHHHQHRHSRGLSRTLHAVSLAAGGPIQDAQVLYNTSNAEGWAHYTEQMMLDEGYGNHDPKLRLGQLLDALLRNARFIVGIEMHTGKMTLEQGQEFFVKEGFQVPPVAEVEAKRGNLRPDLSLLQSGQTADSEVARGLPEAAGQQIHAAGIPRPLHAAGFGAHEDHSQEHAGERQSDSVDSLRSSGIEV